MDIKLPDMKVVIEKLSSLKNLKNYMNLMVPLIIAVVAGLMFIPTALLSSGLKQKVNTESVRKGQALDGMAGAPISKNEYLQERKFLETYAADANRIVLMANESTHRDLLSYKIFPSPTDNSVLIFEEFGKQYKAGVEAKIAQLRGHDAPLETELSEHLRSVQGQSAAGVAGGAGLMSAYSPYSPYGMAAAGRTAGGTRVAGAAGGPGSGGEYGLGGSPVVDQIIEAACLEKAQSSGVYVNPANVAGYNFWTQYQYNAGVAQAVSDCWYWQLGYWIVEDVFDTIRASNAGARDVLDAPVKRLMQVGFMRSMVTLGQGGGYGGGYGYGTAGSQDATQGEPKPRYVMTPYEGLAIPPCTARVSQGNLHVVHFDVTVAVRAGAVTDFMRQLCSAKEHTYSGLDGRQPAKTFKHNQITILETTQRAVDRSTSSMGGPGGYGGYGYGAAYGMPGAGGAAGASAYGTPGGTGLGGMMGLDSGSHQMYRYGQDAVVELDLVCEYIFEKAGYEALIPEAIKKTLESAAGATNP
jgi:hypothetical protein